MKGGKRKSRKSKKSKKKRKSRSGANPALAAFAELSKHVATGCGISNGPTAKRIAGAANRKIKESNPGMGAVEVAKLAMKEFDANKSKYCGMFM